MFCNDKLELMSEENSIDVYTFEKENQEYFEQNLPPRPGNYFDPESFKEITRELLTEQAIMTSTCILLEIARCYGRKNQFKCFRE